MIRRLLIFLIFTLFIFDGFSQNGNLIVEWKRLDNNNIEFNYRKSVPGSYTVKMNFSDLSNTVTGSSQTFTAADDRGQLLTLRATDKDKPINFRYSYSYMLGKLDPKIKEGVKYLLPYPKGRKMKVFDVGFVNETYFGAERSKDWKSIGFYTDHEDTVTNMRKGLVIKIEDGFDNVDAKDVAYTSERNKVFIEHDDGTIMRYSGFRKGTFFVKPGDIVYPGAPLGLNQKQMDNRYYVSTLLYYLSNMDSKDLKGASLSNPKTPYKNIDPTFVYDDNHVGHLLSGTECTSFQSEELITKEMSKRELKKYKK